VAVGAVEAEDVEDHDTFGGVYDLADAQERFAPWDREEFGGARVGDSGVDFFVGVTEFEAVLALKRGEERRVLQWGGEQARELGRGEVAGFESEGFAGCGAKAFELEDAAFGRERESCGGLFFVVDNFGEKDF